MIDHARNFGEHNAVLTGWRHARGAHIVNLDDDGQNPPRRPFVCGSTQRRTGADVVFGHYETKQHSLWRNFGSWFTNRFTDWALDKPHGFYLSSFRCVSAFAAREVVCYAGPVSVYRRPAPAGHSAYRIARGPTRASSPGRERIHVARLLRLWLSAWLNFSLLPLRLATFAGSDHRRARAVAFFAVLWLWFVNRGPGYGFGWLMSAFLIFSGTQLVMFGLDWRVSWADVPDRQPAAASGRPRRRAVGGEDGTGGREKGSLVSKNSSACSFSKDDGLSTVIRKCGRGLRTFRARPAGRDLQTRHRRYHAETVCDGH